METKKIFLSEDEMPRQWYNILADIKMNPPLGPDGKPISPDQLAPVFPAPMTATFPLVISAPLRTLSGYSIHRVKRYSN